MLSVGLTILKSLVCEDELDSRVLSMCVCGKSQQQKHQVGQHATDETPLYNFPGEN